MYIRKRRVKYCQKWVFTRRKVVQFFETSKSKNRVGRVGSIPEWNSRLSLFKVGSSRCVRLGDVCSDSVFNTQPGNVVGQLVFRGFIA